MFRMLYCYVFHVLYIILLCVSRSACYNNAGVIQDTLNMSLWKIAPETLGNCIVFVGLSWRTLTEFCRSE